MLVMVSLYLRWVYNVIMNVTLIETLQINILSIFKFVDN